MSLSDGTQLKLAVHVWHSSCHQHLHRQAFVPAITTRSEGCVATSDAPHHTYTCLQARGPVCSKLWTGWVGLSLRASLCWMSGGCGLDMQPEERADICMRGNGCGREGAACTLDFCCRTKRRG